MQKLIMLYFYKKGSLNIYMYNNNNNNTKNYDKNTMIYDKKYV